MSDVEYKKYEVWIRSRPGFCAQYDGKVDVYAKDESHAEDMAYEKLKRGAFPDRNKSMWQTEKIICKGTNS